MSDTPDDDTTVPVTREMLRRWAGELDRDDVLGSGRHVRVVKEAIRAVLAAAPAETPGMRLTRESWERHQAHISADLDSSPDPEGAEAAQLAPESDTAGEAR